VGFFVVDFEEGGEVISMLTSEGGELDNEVDNLGGSDCSDRRTADPELGGIGDCPGVEINEELRSGTHSLPNTTAPFPLSNRP